MKACLLTSPAAIETRPLRLTEVAAPVPSGNQVLVRVRACGVCRTDLHVVEGELESRKSPVVPGHQVVGVVEANGPAASRFAPGARVGVAWLHHTCGACEYCCAGRENLCERAEFTGWTVDGGYAEYVWRPKISCTRCRKASPTSTRRRCCAPESSGSAPCGFRASRRAAAWPSMVSVRRRTLPSRWQGTGAWKSTRFRGSLAT